MTSVQVGTVEAYQHERSSRWTFAGLSRLHPEAQNAQNERDREILATLAKISEQELRKVSPLDRKLITAGWVLNAREFRLLQGMLSLNCVLLTSTLSLLSQITAFLFCWFAISKILSFARQRKLIEFEKDLPEFLGHVLNFIRTGSDTVIAVIRGASLLSPASPIRREVETMHGRIESGVSINEAIAAMGTGIEHDRFGLFRHSLILQSQVGGTIAPQIERLIQGTYTTQAQLRSAQAAVGLARSSMMFIIVLLFVVLAYLSFVVPEMVAFKSQDSIGRFITEIGVVFIASGLAWITSVCDLSRIR